LFQATHIREYDEIYLKNVGNILNIQPMFGIITIASSLPLPNWGEMADSGEPQV
jgi:hypothetical protein